MKRILSLILATLMLLSASALSALAAGENETFRLAFSENFDGALTPKLAHWDPKGSLGSTGASGTYGFSGKRLSIGTNSRVSLISASGSEEAANFRNGIMEFDLHWNESSRESSAALCIEFYDNSATSIEVIQFYSQKVQTTNAGKSVDLTSGTLGVAKPGFENGKVYRIKIYMVQNPSAQNLNFRVYRAEMDGNKEKESYALIGLGAAARNFFTAPLDGGFIRFRTSSKYKGDVGIDNLNFYVKDDAGDKTASDIIPDFYAFENMTDEEKRVASGLADLEVVQATQKRNGTKFNLIFEDNLDVAPGTQAHWDPDKLVMSSTGTSGTIKFENGKLSIAKNARKAIVGAGQGQKAADFSRGIVQFDLGWKSGAESAAAFSLQLGTLASGELTNIQFYKDNIKTSYLGSGRSMSFGYEGVSAFEFEDGKEYRLQVLVEKIPERKCCYVKIYMSPLTDGKEGEWKLIANAYTGTELYAYAGGGCLRFLTSSKYEGPATIDNIKVYEPADSPDKNSIDINKIITCYAQYEKEIETDLEAQKDVEGIRMLERIGMIIGEGDGVTEKYLKTQPTRVQAAVLTLRLRGLEDEAKAFESNDNFADIDNVGWAKNILAYIKAHPELGMVGVGDNCFDPLAPITQQAYVKILLESLGYKYNEDFTWGEVLSFAREKGMDFEDASEFNVREVAKTTKAGLYTQMKGQSTKLFASIVSGREGIHDPEYADFVPTEEYLSMREAAQHKDYGLMLNNDGGDSLLSVAANAFGQTYATAEEIPEEKVTEENFYYFRFDTMLDPDAPKDIKGVAKVDTIVYCTTHTFRANTIREGNYLYSLLAPQKYWSPRLFEKTGKDPLDLAIKWSRKNGYPIFWSTRMNDTHDKTGTEEDLIPWKKEHLNLLLDTSANKSRMPAANTAWSALDFSHPECREYVYEYIKSVVQNYDIDGLELDFFRHFNYLQEVKNGEKVYPESLEKINDLMRAIRKMVDAEGQKRGKAIPIAIKVPDSLGYCYNIGLDVETWIDEDLFDIAGVGGYWLLSDTWEQSVDYYQNQGIPCYPCLSRDTIGTCRNYENWRNEAALAWNSGAKGISTFNILQGNEDVLRFLGDKEAVGKPAEDYKRKDIDPSNTRGNPGQWLRDGEKFMSIDPYPENWSTMKHEEKIY